MQQPEWTRCPITREVMTVPVVGSDGHTYDADAILQALAVRGLSPLTNAPMHTNSLVVNYALRDAIAWVGGVNNNNNKAQPNVTRLTRWPEPSHKN